MVISPLAQGADQFIAAAGLAQGYQLQTLLPGPQGEYEKTFDLGDKAPEVAFFGIFWTVRARATAPKNCPAIDA